MTIKGYELTSDWKIIGGMSEIAFARKDGKDWFIKKFICPKFPLPDSPGSERMKEKQRKKCDVFEKHHKDINSRLSSCCGLGGSLIYAVEFFREGTCYYKINEKIEAESMSVSDISKLDSRNLLIILRSLVYSLKILHHAKIVHGDLKPDNVLIKLTSTGTYTTKLIDFDDSYISGNPPSDRSLVVGTPEYYSPEMYRYITDEDGVISGSTLTTKSDIFALGVIFTEFLTGSKPIIPNKYSGTYSAVEDDAAISFAASVNFTPEMEKLVRRSLKKNPNDRPTIDEVLSSLPMLKPKMFSKPKIIRFEALNSKAIKGDDICLSWVVENASVVSINGAIVSLTGTKMFPAVSEFEIIATDSSGKTTNKTISIKIDEPASIPTSNLTGTMLKRRTK